MQALSRFLLGLVPVLANLEISFIFLFCFYVENLSIYAVPWPQISDLSSLYKCCLGARLEGGWKGRGKKRRPPIPAWTWYAGAALSSVLKTATYVFLTIHNCKHIGVYPNRQTLSPQTFIFFKSRNPVFLPVWGDRYPHVTKGFREILMDCRRQDWVSKECHRHPGPWF